MISSSVKLVCNLVASSSDIFGSFFHSVLLTMMMTGLITVIIL